MLNNNFNIHIYKQLSAEQKIHLYNRLVTVSGLMKMLHTADRYNVLAS